jgi:predicted anti-sigma-YlaC factor YlaD
MHEPIRNDLEAYLKRSERGGLSAEFTAHINECERCRTELRDMGEQSELLKLLKPPAEVEPRSGFYARVIERIDSQRQNSFWGIFLEPRVGRRIAMASAAMVVLMGVYLFSTEPGTSRFGNRHAPEPVVVQMLNGDDQQAQIAGAGTIEQDRNAVLVNLVTYRDQQ